MPKQKAIALMTELHERFADDVESEQQKQLLSELQQHVHELGEAEAPEPDMVDALEVLVTDAEASHPAVVGTLRSLLETLRNIGV